jgi:hypothetical protein
MTQSYFEEIVLAGFGGLLVVIGLLMEHFGNRDWYEYKCLPEGRSKSLKWVGEWFVILGVGIEVLVACFTAANEWQNRPSNKPIASISAKIEFIVRGTNTPVSSLGGQLAIGNPESEKNGAHTLYPFFDSDFKWVYLKDSKTLWIMECEEMPLTDSFSSELVRDADKWNVFEIQVPFIAAGTEIIGGNIVLNINSILKTNDIPPQTIRSLKYFHEIYVKNPTTGVWVFGQ